VLGVRAAIGVAGGLVLAGVVFYGAIIGASESGEVVTLRTRGGDGTLQATRLWLVDHAGAEWVRTGHPEKGWFVRLQADPRVELERAGVWTSRTAVVVTDAAVSRGVNDVFRQKYGAADWIVALSGDASDRVPVRLDPSSPRAD
jgi:hypothetical protein